MSATFIPPGMPAYTYLWSQLSGDGGIIIDSSTSASTTFSASTGPGDFISGTFACTVTDSAAHTASSGVVTVQFQTPS